jgi:hypothetical protein
MENHLIGYGVLGIEHLKAVGKAFSTGMTMNNTQYPAPNAIS